MIRSNGVVFSDLIHDRMYQAGAHFVVDGINDVPMALERIEKYLAQGVSPYK